jgi:transposase-like protein
VCTQLIVHTMLKEPDTAGYPPRRTHRTYTREFKAELVAACQQPGVSIAALASSHAMNANVLHRWLKEHERSGFVWGSGRNFTRPSVHRLEAAHRDA